jgi:rhodanese-related sulfurtransferase
VIIDVRDDDEFAAGHVVGANHLPCDLWRNPAFVQETADRFKMKEEVVLHCFMSQQRGVACARLLALAYERSDEDNKPTVYVSILFSISNTCLLNILLVPCRRVMRGGFCEFGKQFGNNSVLVKNL